MERFGPAFIQDVVSRTLARHAFSERLGAEGGPLMVLKAVTSDGPARAAGAVPAPEGAPAGDTAADRRPGEAQEAGFVRLWAAPEGSLADRMVHCRLVSGPVNTDLFFLFGRADTTMPHFHLQTVQFTADAWVYNADFMARLDPVDHPEYFRRVFHPLNEPYWRTTGNEANACSRSVGNPALAVYLSPWTLGVKRPANRSEFDRVTPALLAFHDHWLALLDSPPYTGPDAETLRHRDARHLACFLDERLDPRAWQGVYRLIGQQAGQALRSVLQTPLSR